MEASTAIQSRLIGAILVQKNLITAEQLERALQLQHDTGERLGEIVVGEFGISRLELASVLAEQWAELENAERHVAVEPGPAAAVEPLTPDEVQIRRPIGEIFVELGFIDGDQLGAALDLQRETGARIGEILVEQGSLTRLDLASALAEQWSALQKLRPPAPAAEPQPWQNRMPLAQSDTPGSAGEDRAVVAALEERLRIVERAAAATPWQEDLQAVASELRAAVAAVEARPQVGAAGRADMELEPVLEAMQGRIARLEATPLPTEVDALRRELEELKARPVTVEGLAELRDAVELLEGRQDPAPEIARIETEVTGLLQRFDEATAAAGLTEKLDAVAGQAEVAQTGIAGLSRRVDELAGLERRLDEVSARLPREEVIEELRRALADLASKAESDDRADQGADIASLVARLDQVEARLADAAPHAPDLTPRLDELAARVDEVAAAIPVDDPEELRVRIDSLEARADQAADGAPVDAVRSRVDELAALVEQAAEPPGLDQMRTRLAELAAMVAREPDTGPLDDVRARLDELAGALVARVNELELRLATATPGAELQDEMRRVAESRIVERESIAQALFDRVEELTVRLPREDELAEIRSRLEELAARPLEDLAAHERVDELAARLDGLGAVEQTIAGLHESLDGLDARRVGDALATGARLAGLEQAVESLASLRDRPGEEAASNRVESRYEAGDALEERIAGLAAELDRRPDAAALAAVADELRTALTRLADRSPVAEPSERLQELSQKIDEVARNGHDRIARVAEELNERLDGLRATSDSHEAALAAALADAERARLAGQGDLAGRLDEAIGAVRSELEAQGEDLRSRHQAHGDETAALRADVEELHQAAAGRAAWEAGIESLLERRVEELAGRLGDEIAGVRAQAQEATAAVHGETVSVAARIDEMLALRHTDMQTARAATDDLAARVDALAGLRADDAEAARAAADDLSTRLEALVDSLHAEAADARIAADGVAAQIGGLHGLRADDLAAAELAGAELAARLDDHAVRSAAAAFEVEQALRDELGGIAARLEERDVQGIEAREELRAELERIASSVGWRLERIEESLAADDTMQLKAAVAELSERLEGQAEMREEQTRATERALRKGLASLGEKLADSESAYVDAGNALRRSIERLGAAVVEADARMADQIPVTEQEGCVAFAPTAAGYRLVELPGTPPELGSTIELENGEGPLVVTRYGRSPLPLDNRPCAYLDRA